MMLLAVITVVTVYVYISYDEIRTRQKDNLEDRERERLHSW